MSGHFGEIITTIIGDDRVQRLYEEKAIPPELAGKTGADIALSLGIISTDTITALLVAQAAERTLQLADKAEEYANSSEVLISSYKEAFIIRLQEKGQSYTSADRPWLEEDSAGYAGYDCPIFKFIGADRDPDVLKAAQGTWLAAQVYLNNEVDAINAYNSEAADTPCSMGPEYADGFRKAAAGYYKMAGDLLAKEGHLRAAESFTAIAKSIAADIPAGKTYTPAKLVSSLLFRAQRGIQDVNIILGSQCYLDEEYEGTMNKLIRLTTLGASLARAEVLRSATVLQKDTRTPKLRLRKDLFKP